MQKKTSKKRTLARKIQNGIRKIRVLKKKATRSKKRDSLHKKVSSLKKKTVKARPSHSSRKNNQVQSNKFSSGISPEQTQKEVVEVSKFTAIESPQGEFARYSLPSRYNDDRIVLVPRDPWWVHTYWDISEGKINEVISGIPIYERENLIWVLRMHDVTGIRDFNGNNSNSYYDVNVHFEANNWYVNVNAPEKEWCAEIGLKTQKGNFFAVARSNIVKTPYFGVSDIVDEEWAMPDEEYFKLLGVYNLGNSSLAVKKKRLNEILKKQISSGAFSGGLSSASSLMERRQEKNFFLEVWTELILYGRTRSDATVSVGGRKVKLRDDGTFSLRYALDEGDFRFDVTATSRDEADSITIIPAVKRYTIK